MPLETTFVCTIPLADMALVEWEQSRVFRKLRRVLWVPVQGERDVPVEARRIGTALLRSPPGFYLRTSFTAHILAKHFALARS